MTRYTATLLQMYADNFRYGSDLERLSAGCFLPSELPTAEIRSCGNDPLLEFGGHVQGRGDLWAWPDGWLGEPKSRKAIEGMVVLPQAGLSPDDVECRAMFANGKWSGWCKGGEFCGTRGRDLPLSGFCIRLCADTAPPIRLSYTATFVDGTNRGPLEAGETCKAESMAPLEAFRLDAEPVA
ncbi:MAG: hypothetical protein JOZ58_06640 [Acetobacteraceae bacterium]|nr:hypothetical protein [Acetobacteraceae bacterium]